MGFFELDTEAAAKAKAAWEEEWKKVEAARKAWEAEAEREAWEKAEAARKEAEEKMRTLGKE